LRFGELRRLELIDGAFLLARFHLVSLAGGGRDGRPKYGGGDRDGLVLWWPLSCGGLGGYGGVGDLRRLGGGVVLGAEPESLM
jgi:hypothetical protein